MLSTAYGTSVAKYSLTEVLVIRLYRYVHIDSCNADWRKLQGYHHEVYLGGFSLSFCQGPVSVVM